MHYKKRNGDLIGGFTAPNGMRVYLMSCGEAEDVSVKIRVAKGAAHFLENLMCSLDSSTGHNQTVFSLDFPLHVGGKSADGLFSSMIFQLVYPPKDSKSVREAEAKRIHS
eukprot:Trichotokara_eunicae@DN9539_c0_g1_i1.p1